MDLIRTFLRDVQPGDTILDIGANIGGYASTFRQQHPTANIHAFEPVPSVFTELKARFASDPQTFCWNLGVGANRGLIEGVAVHEAWTINRPGETIRGRNATYGQDTFDMEVTTVDAFFANWPRHNKFSAIKIDTDGYDFRVLRGAQDTIRRCMPRILIELGYCITDLDGRGAVDWLATWGHREGYRVYDETGKPCDLSTILDWYPFQTTADFLLVPAEQALNPVE